MSGRCYACNARLTEEDLKRKWFFSQEYTNLCYYCYDKTINYDQNHLEEEIDIDNEYFFPSL